MGALDGITVLDVSEIMQAPLAAMMLADFGANVIKIERPGVGDLLRPMDAKATAEGKVSSYYASLNRNKRSVCLDLKTQAGKEVLETLARTADVIINNYRPGAMERLGLGYEDMRKINPRLIYAVATGFGESGPLAAKAGQDMLAQSSGGITAATSVYLGQPALLSTPLIDYASGMTLAQGIAFALLERERSGLGQKVSVNLLDTAIAAQCVEAASNLMYGRNMNWFKDALSFIFETQDGWITVLGFFRPNPLQRLCLAFDIEDMTEDPQFASLPAQVRAKDLITERFAPLFKAYTTEECARRLEAQDLLNAPILSLLDVLGHPQVRENGMLGQLTIEGQGTYEALGNPVKLSRTPAIAAGFVAKLGTDTVDVLREFGIDGKAIDDLSAKGAFGKTL